MAEPLSKAPRPVSMSLPTPSTPYTPSPLTPTGRPRLGPRRQSRFTEDMTERTPAASISDRSMDYYWYGPSTEDVNIQTSNTNNTNNTNNNLPVPDAETAPGGTGIEGQDRKAWLRFANGALHAAPCLVLLGILGYALRVLRENAGSYMGIQAIVLICVLFADVVLDVITLFRAQTPWPTWGLVLRVIYGIAYIALFLVYVGLGGPFPRGYTYWGLSVDMAAPVVYILLCVQGLWNLLHPPVCRYNLGRTLLAPLIPTPKKPPSPPANNNNNNNNDDDENDKRTSFNPRFSATAGTEHSSISLTWQRWVRTRSSSTQYTHSHRHSRGDDDLETGGVLCCPQGTTVSTAREASADSTLREQPGEEEEGDQDVGSGDGSSSSRVASSHYTGKVEEGERWCEKVSEETVRPPPLPSPPSVKAAGDGGGL